MDRESEVTWLHHSYGYIILRGRSHPIRCECGEFHPACNQEECDHDGL